MGYIRKIFRICLTRLIRHFLNYLDIVQKATITGILETTADFILSWTKAAYANLCSYKVVVNNGVIAENLQTASLSFDISPFDPCKANVAQVIIQSPSGKEGPADELSFAKSEYTISKKITNSCVF